MTTASPSHVQSLPPSPRILLLDRIERDANRFRLTVQVEQEPACPLCGAGSRSRHSFYSRRLQELYRVNYFCRSRQLFLPVATKVD
jgi:hypothetical protein